MKSQVFIVMDEAQENLPWAVKDRDSGETIGRAPDEAGAARLALDYAQADTTDGEPFAAVLCVEGVDTGDGRYLEPGMGSWRNLPQPLMAQTTIPEMGGHAGAVLAGRIDSIRMDGRRMMAKGVFDAGPEGSEAARLVNDQMLRFVSIDMAECDVVIEPVAFDDEGYPVEVLARFGPYEIMGATATPHPAIKQAVIWLTRNPAPAEVYDALPEPLGAPRPMPEPESMPLLASAEPVTLALLASGEAKPPTRMFLVPEADELTPLTVTEEGGIYGHIASWDCCHIGFLNKCVTPPRGAEYANFLTGSVLTADGDRIPTGTLTAWGGHPDERLSAEAARAHHDDVSMACADVTIRDGKIGPWVSGAIRPGVTEEQLRVMRGSAPSGDWRPIRGKLELVNIHYVNTPGFPVPTLRARVASGELVGLVASIGHAADEPETAEPEPVEVAEPDTTVADRLAVVERAISPLLNIAHDAIAAKHEAPPEPSALERYAASKG